jgi:hypothetical protein
MNSGTMHRRRTRHLLELLGREVCVEYFREDSSKGSYYGQVIYKTNLETRGTRIQPGFYIAERFIPISITSAIYVEKRKVVLSKFPSCRLNISGEFK